MADVRQNYWRNSDDESDAVDAPDGSAEVSAEDSTEPLTAEDSPEVADEVAELSEEEGDVEVTMEEAELAWVPAAQTILTRVAGIYHGLIDHSELANEIQEMSGIHTRRQVRSWIGSVLTEVARGNHARQEPPLTALVVHKSDGTTGVGFDEVMRLSGGEVLEDPTAREKHAAKARMECYDWAGAHVPTGGGRPLVSPRFEQVQGRLRKERRAAEQPSICPSCFMAIPPTGVCDNCG